MDGITNSMDEFEQAPGVGDGQGSLACCNPWGGKESDTTEQLNCAELKDQDPSPLLVSEAELFALAVGWEQLHDVSSSGCQCVLACLLSISFSVPTLFLSGVTLLLPSS